MIKDLICKLPTYMKPAGANALFPPASNEMSPDVKFRYMDNKIFSPNCCELVSAPSGLGKGFLDEMCSHISHLAAEHDHEAELALLQWQKDFKSKGANAQKPNRPEVALLNPDPDMTNPAFIINMMCAEKEKRSVYSNIAEIELLDQCCGGHKKVSKVLRLNFDNKRYGALRATVDGVTGKPLLNWKINVSCVPEKARAFFKTGVIDGTLGRIGCDYTPKSAKKERGIPRQGSYDQKYMESLDEYLMRLRNAHGEIRVPKLKGLIEALAEELEELEELSDDDVFSSLANRSLIIGWMKGCILYVGEGMKMTKEILDFVRWSILNDLWSKLQLFGSQFNYGQKVVEFDARKNGPRNMLDQLADAFSQTDLEKLRIEQGKPSYCRHQLDMWISRGYITYSNSTRLYTKSEEYLKKHKA